MIELALLDARAASNCAHMTFPAYRHMLSLEATPRLRGEVLGGAVLPLGIVAVDAGRVVGLALAETPTEENATPELLSLFVEPSSRGFGVGTALVARMEAEMASRSFRQLAAVYTGGTASAPAIERIFARRQWHPPAPRTLRVKFTPKGARRTPWFGRVRLDSAEEIIDWVAVGDAERRVLRASQEQEPWIPRHLEPWLYDSLPHLDARSSLALRRNGRIVGWVINHRLSDGSARFTCSFVRQDLGRRGRILPLYTESIDRLDRCGVEACLFVTPISFAPMVAFIVEHCSPWCDSVTHTMGTLKRLDS